ncbi:lytic transglycosylase domain-containing protein [Bacteriovorax sp. PP10]|uniref:Lytic transglycosylase domain-containing protein n=1 Tax=Bacteriovorax antarcticus TaxID=3088717 RepID=A0ABU5VVX0_9BACT|nr:lytic transglycosylase domain-containing protein [Bacteriovorax sp. PP10]MEA9356528.1 lytic transglycosylase domain-containing protein [Bacteriovorax sp. PP10]
MKFLKGLCISIVLGSLWGLAGYVADVRIQRLERIGLLPYGPLPAVAPVSYSYEGLPMAFDSSLPLKRASELPKKEFEALLMSSLTPAVQTEIKPYIGAILNLSVEYQMDPFWIVSIIMVESNFKLTALSHKNARGLMQIKPDTAQHLYQLMQITLTEDQVSENLYHPEKNIEVGVFYLKKLLQNFRMNYRFATVAYNIGPQKLRNRLTEKSLDVDNFSYLVKVKDRYMLLSQNFSKIIKHRPMPFEGTYVYSEQGLKMEERIVNLFPQSTSENLTAKF